MLLKCFTEISTLLDTLRAASLAPGNFKQQKKMMATNAAPVPVNIDDSDVEDDLIAKLTGRLEQVFESARHLKGNSGRGAAGASSMRSGRYNARFSLNNRMAAINEEE